MSLGWIDAALPSTCMANMQGVLVSRKPAEGSLHTLLQLGPAPPSSEDTRPSLGRRPAAQHLVVCDHHRPFNLQPKHSGSLAVQHHLDCTGYSC